MRNGGPASAKVVLDRPAVAEIQEGHRVARGCRSTGDVLLSKLMLNRASRIDNVRFLAGPLEARSAQSLASWMRCRIIVMSR